MSAKLTDKQRKILSYLSIILENQKRRIAQDVASGMLPPGSYASEWVFVTELENACKTSYRDILSLVKKGWLEVRPTDGWGNEVRRTTVVKE